MAIIRTLLTPLFLLAILAGCEKAQTPPAPKLDDSASRQSMPETKMPAPDNAQPAMQPPSSIQR